ncbi:hypothetical protein C0989_002266 [Termitomyces sp. Mn162]|nr:hypothetical protein C0989_002266 [Termitomyces sp. Mn162]
MASRRLDISSLLCNDQISDPVILAPHLKQPSQSSSSQFIRHASSSTTSPTFSASSQMLLPSRPSSSHSIPSRHRHSPSSNPYPLPSPPVPSSAHFVSPAKPQSFGLEALVQVATEERRRLSVSSPPESETQRHPSPSIEQRHILQSQHYHHQPPFRQHKAAPNDHVRSPLQHHSPVLSPAQPIPSQPIHSPVQLIRSPSVTQHQSQSRHRAHRDDSQISPSIGTAEDVPYRSPQSAYPQPQLPRQQSVHDHRVQQQLELDRQRMHHEQLLRQEQQHHQNYVRERQAIYTERPVLSPPSHSIRGASVSLHGESPVQLQPHPQLPPPPPPPRPPTNHQHPSGRKSDPGQPHHVFHPGPVPPLSAPPFPQAAGDSVPHSSKRRRYSEVSVEEQERIQREREKMVTGDLGYGRPEPIINSGNPGPSRPDSSHGQGRKHLGLVELMTPIDESYRAQPVTGSVTVERLRPEVQTQKVLQGARREAELREGGLPQGSSLETNTQGVMPEGREGSLHLSTPHDGKSRDSSPPEGGSRLITPHRRRSPPGSQSGRALAAKKTEEVELSLHDLLPQAPEPIQPLEIERKSPLQEREKTALHESKPVSVQKMTTSLEKDTKPIFVEKEGHPVITEKETKKRTPSQTMVDHSTLAEPRPSKKQRTVSVASAPKAAEEDAHEWFLEHFDDYNEPRQSRLLSPREHSPPARPSPPSRHSSRARTHTPTPSAIPDAADALEQELEELLPDPPQISKVEPMEVDLVTELVAETLDADDAKIEDVGMEVDVEDELLSLLDDQPTSRRTITKSAKVPPSTVKPPPPSGSSGGRHISPSGMSPVSVPSPATHVPPTGRSASARPASERESMPPPTSVTPVRGKEEKVTERASSSVAPNKKKKDALSKSGAKNKVTPAVSAGTKPRARPGPKPKPKISDASLSATAAKSKAATGNKKQAASRSRSTSVMPNGSAGPEGSEAKTEKQEEEEESDQEDDKLYCVCKTTYDEDRFMIACDRCDDWYHTQCVNMPDLEVDLVDQFICPPCIEKHPHLNLKTTYKTRCLYGLSHPDPSSPEACHRPARGAFSKFCSDECGSKCMQSRVDAWVKKGGKKEKLWETVKNAEKREGVVVCAMELNGTKSDVDKDNEDQNHKQKKSKTEREIGRLNGLLDSVVKLREDIKKEMECVMWREKLLELATTRAEQIEECGWDQRLCFGDDQCADLGAGVLESYDLQDGDKDVSSGDWWCSGKKVCDRHAGWQAVRVKDVCKEKEKKNDALMNLTTREREIRKQIEDLLEPHGRDCNDTAGKLPLTATNAKLPNGHTKGKTNGDTTKKGKKRKAPS